MILHQLFSDIDDFCNRFLPTQNSHRLSNDVKKRYRTKCLCESKIMTIVIQYQMSGYRTFKWLCLKHIMVFWQKAFPNYPATIALLN